MPSRRQFLGASAGFAVAAAAAQLGRDDRISLAAWSLNRSYYRAHRWKNLDLPRICREQFGISGLELVTGFFDLPNVPYLRELKKQGKENGVTFVRIMVDNEGAMAALDKAERMESAIAHRKWVDIAHYLGCQDIRCNVRGPAGLWKQDRDFPKRAAESFKDLLDYSRGSGLDICIENHGGASSDPGMLLPLLKAVGDSRLGTLPDFGNINEGDDRYEIIRRIVPYAKGVSVKAEWRDDDSSAFDLDKLIGICRDAGFRGWWGIESVHGPERDLSPDQIWAQELKDVRLTQRIVEHAITARRKA